MPQSGSTEGLIRKLSDGQVNERGSVPDSPQHEGLFVASNVGYRLAGTEYTNSNLSADKICVTALPATDVGHGETRL